MKKFTKLLGIVLIIALVMSMGVAAFADGETTTTGTNKITVTGTIKDETYKVYKMFDLVVDDPTNLTAFKYTVAAGWSDFFTTGYGKDYVTINTTDGHIEWKEGMDAEAKMILLAQEAEKVATNPAATKVAEGTTVEFTGLENGYYLITSTLGTKAMIDSTPTNPAQTIAEKNPEDTIEKEVQEDSNNTWGDKNDAQVGDTVNFRSTATVQPYTRNVYIHDTMGAGLDYQNDVAIEGLTAGTDYVVLTTPQEGDTFTIQITDTYIASLTSAATLKLTYTAKLNEKAVVTVAGEAGSETTTLGIVDQKNKTQITYGDKQSVEDETTTTTHKFSVFKHAKDKTDNLPGAVFELKKAGTAVTLIKIDDTNYRVANATEAASSTAASSHVDSDGKEQTVAAGSKVSNFITVASGDIVIWGVDSDNDYTLNEVKAPDGYNKLAAEVSVTVNADNSTRVDVENNSGTELPSTGGIGTTIFYVVGSILVVAAGVLLITKKRMGREG